VTLFFSNANISPSEEFATRLESTQLLAKHAGVPLLIDEPQHSDWLECVAKGFEKEKEKGARCERCFRYSLERTHTAMLANGFDGFTTTLSVSPHKHTPTLFAVGRAIDPERFLAINFKKNEGFKHSLALAAELGICRQKYCGCEFSIRP
jgi:predicted adenine nucleotide alpha hydrolase (AANH) superfamily ATPase